MSENSVELLNALLGKDKFIVKYKKKTNIIDFKIFFTLTIIFNRLLKDVNIEMMNLNNTSIFWDKTLVEKKRSILKSEIYRSKNKIILKLISNLEGKLLNIGFGYGILEEQIIQKKFNLKLFGIDISNNAVKNLNKKYGIKYKLGDIRNIKFKNSYFNVVLALDVIEHLNNTGVSTALQEIRRILKNNGILIISIPINEKKEDSIRNKHLQNFSSRKLNNILSKYKFIVNKEIQLSAFRNYFILKNIINKIFKVRNNNLLIVVAKKQ